jgi:hypothetical protein
MAGEMKRREEEGSGPRNGRTAAAGGVKRPVRNGAFRSREGIVVGCVE